MTQADSTHPGERELREFVMGMLDESKAKAVETHLARCDQCNDLLLSLDLDDRLIEVLRSLGAPASSTSTSVEQVTIGLDERPVQPAGSSAQSTNAIGRYEILDELGRGGMGVVYRARDRELQREVALKVIIAGEHSTEAVRARFRHEAQTIARLKHPGIVQIYEVDQWNGQPYLALELVQGTTLQQLTHATPQPIRWSATMVLQLAEATHFAHQQSIVHRDLKPGNVLVVGERKGDHGSSTWTPSIPFHTGDAPVSVPVAKITDFGLAKQLDSDLQFTKSGQAMGTPAYMSPEQAGGRLKEIGPATDVYALGAILYDLLAGQPPFRAGDAMATMMAVLEDDPDSPRTHRKEIPIDLETICMKCLAKSPEERYPSARDLAIDLELFLQGDPIHARPPSRLRRLVRWARHRPQLALTYAACIVLFALHLFAKHVLELPFHNTVLAKAAPFLIGGWASAATLIQWWANRAERRAYGHVAFLVLTIVWMTVVFAMDRGPSSAPVPMYLVLIAGSALMISRPEMVWFSTCAGTISYASLVAYANYVSNIGQVGMEQAFGFIGSMFVMGVCIHLMLRRAVRRPVMEHDEGGVS